MKYNKYTKTLFFNTVDVKYYLYHKEMASIQSIIDNLCCHNMLYDEHEDFDITHVKKIESYELDEGYHFCFLGLKDEIEEYLEDIKKAPNTYIFYPDFEDY